MIRFSAFLVVVAVGLLVAGVVTSKLLLVYIAIGVSGVALLALGVGAAVNWRELTGKPGTAQPGTAEPGTLEPSAQGPAPQAAVPEPVTSPAAAPERHPAGPAGPPPSLQPGPARPGSATCPSASRRGPGPRPPPSVGRAPSAAGRVHPAPRGPGARCLGVARRFDPGPSPAPRPGPALCSRSRLRAPARPGLRPAPRSPRPSPDRSAVASCDAGIRRRGVRASGLPQARRVGRACHVTSADPEARPVPRRTRVGRQARSVTGRPATRRAAPGHGAVVG